MASTSIGAKRQQLLIGLIEDWGIGFNNSNIQNGYSVALLIQYGHATKGGGCARVDFTLRPIFNKIAEECWKEVQKL